MNIEKNLRQTARVDVNERLSLFLSFNEKRREIPRQTPPVINYTLGFLERAELKLTSSFLYTLEHRFKRLDQDSRSFGDAGFTEHQLNNKLRCRINQELELILKPNYLVDNSRHSNLRVTMWETAAEANRRMVGIGRISAKFAYQNVTSSGGDQFIPFQYAGGRRLGDNMQWGTSVELRFSKNISASLSYDGEKIPRLDVRHISSATVKARF